ncbi:pilus assembly protein [Pseudoalteromonas maricaloris]|nr:pilus assembly protein [Pseudoalteromonas maricaloris]
MIGGGGHAAALAEILLKQGKKIVGVIAPEITAGHAIFNDIQHFENDGDIKRFDKLSVILVNGIGAMPKQNLREKLYNYYRQQGYKFATIVADSAVVSDFATLAQGVQIMNNSVVNIGVSIDENSIVNTSSVVDHDCIIGAHCHIAPGVTMSGQVVVKNNVHIATGANVINNVLIEENVIVSVGASITKSVANGSIVFGARSITKGIKDEH